MSGGMGPVDIGREIDCNIFLGMNIFLRESRRSYKDVLTLYVG